MLLTLALACVTGVPAPKVHVSSDITSTFKPEILLTQGTYRLSVWIPWTEKPEEYEKYVVILQRKGPMGRSTWVEDCGSSFDPSVAEVEAMRNWVGEEAPKWKEHQAFRIVCDFGSPDDTAYATEAWIVRSATE